MHVRVLFFGVLKNLLPGESESLELPQGATVQTLLGVYRHRLPQNDALWSSLAVAVNQQYASSGEPLAENDEVALLPPVSGGSGSGDSGAGGSESSRNAGRDPSSPVHQISLTREPIDAAALLAATKQPEDGAAVVFDGVVRNHTRGRRTLFLDYEAYEEMALAQMRELAAEAGRRFEVHAITIVHRLGRLQIGETSILIAVASPHRGAAFDACRFLIDTLKKTVPIWKREHFEDGAVWRDGEPFPAEIAASGGRPPA